MRPDDGFQFACSFIFIFITMLQCLPGDFLNTLAYLTECEGR